MAFAIAEFCGSKTITSPPKSSLRVAVLHFGQVFSFVREWQVAQAFSLIWFHLSSGLLLPASVPASSPLPPWSSAGRILTIPVCLGRAVSLLRLFFLNFLLCQVKLL